LPPQAQRACGAPGKAPVRAALKLRGEQRVHAEMLRKRPRDLGVGGRDEDAREHALAKMLFEERDRPE